jgi:hypothetical protein
MKNVDLEQKYFTLQQENAHLASQNESLRSETCSLVSSSEYATLHSPPHSPCQPADINNGHGVDSSPHDEQTHMSEVLRNVTSKNQELEKRIEEKEGECLALQRQLGKASRIQNLMFPFLNY